MTDRTDPEALRLAEILEGDYCPDWFYEQGVDEVAAELRRLHARVAELEAQLESIGAGGVSGPLMGQPQAMPDLSALTERGAKAWAGVDAQGLREGVASAGSEPVAWTTGLNWRTDTRCQSEMVVKLTRKSQPEYGFTQPLYTHPSSPEGTVGGWQDIATAPKDGTRILLHPAIEVADAWSKGHWNDENKCWIVGGSPSGIAHTSWAPLPPAPPTTPAGSGKGE